MRTKNINLNQTIALCSLLSAICIGVADAAVVSRSQRPSNAARASAVATNTQKPTTSTTDTTVDTPTETTPVESEITDTTESESEVFCFNAEPSFVHHVYEGADAEDAA